MIVPLESPVTRKIHTRRGASGIERRLWDAVVPGEEVVARPAEEVPADLIRQLAMGIHLPEKPHRLRLRGARITGELDFEAATLRCPLELTDCELGSVNLEQAHAPAIYLLGCRFTQLRALFWAGSLEPWWRSASSI